MNQKVIQSFIHVLFGVLLYGCAAPLHHTEKVSPAIKISGNLSSGSDSATEALIAPYRIPLTDKMKTVLVSSDSVAAKGLPESSLGNLTCDLLVQYAHDELATDVDFCFLNSGGLRIELPKGEITLSMLYELMPFENQLVLFNFTGNQLTSFLNQISVRNGGPVAGLRMGIYQGTPYHPLVGGKEIDPLKHYTVLTSDYLFYGGDSYKVEAPEDVRLLTILLRDALIRTMEKTAHSGQLIHPRKDGRLYLVDTP